MKRVRILFIIIVNLLYIVEAEIHGKEMLIERETRTKMERNINWQNMEARSLYENIVINNLRKL